MTEGFEICQELMTEKKVSWERFFFVENEFEFEESLVAKREF